MKKSVVCEYKGFDESIDKKLRGLAKKYSARENGSGYYIPGDTRDISFEFKNDGEAGKFIFDVAERLGKKVKKTRAV